MATELTLQDDMDNFTYVDHDPDGMQFDNSSGQVYLWVKNDDETPVFVSVIEQRTCSFGHPQMNTTATLSAGTSSIMGPFDLMRFNDSNRKAQVTFASASASASDIQVAAVKA